MDTQHFQTLFVSKHFINDTFGEGVGMLKLMIWKSLEYEKYVRVCPLTEFMFCKLECSSLPHLHCTYL